MKMIKLNDAQLSSISAAHRHHCGRGNGNGLIRQLEGLLRRLGKHSTINLNLNISVIVISNSQIGGNLNISVGQGIFV